MKLKVNSVSIEVTEPEIIVARAVKTYECEFEFDETWSEYQKKAEFKKGHIVKEVLLEDNKCVIPWEVLKARGFLKIGVYGVCGDKRRPTLWTDNILISEGAFEGDEEKEPTKTLFQRVVEIMDETKAIAQSVRDDADAGEFNGEKGERGEPGSIRFIPVVTLPTEDIDESAIYLLPLENEAGENRFTEYAYIDGKWEVIGAITVQVDHSEYVKFTDMPTPTKGGVVRIPTLNYGLEFVESQGTFRIKNPSDAVIANRKEYNFEAVTLGKFDKTLKAGLTTNTEEWTDEDKAKACETIGALQKITWQSTYPNVYIKNANGTQGTLAVTTAPFGGGVVQRYDSGQIHIPEVPTADVHATSKKYVDNLPDYLTNMTAEQKAKWKAFFESILA